MIVISNPIPIENEINLTHSLFAEGLLLFHVRKPDFSVEEMKQFLSKIETEHRSKLVLHSHHQLAEEFGIHRIHFNGKMRKETSEESLKNWKEKGFKLSTSIHSMTDFEKLSDVYEYALISPVFESISKPNYASNLDFRMELKNRKNSRITLVALGGIAPNTIRTAYEYGFDKVALLGIIWNSNNPIENFKLCHKIDLLH